MKKKITDNEHKRWATLPLSMRHIEYAAKDAYAVQYHKQIQFQNTYMNK